MSSPEMTQRSRRGILAAAVGGAAALAANALGRPTPSSAANGEAVTVGQTKTGTSPTALVVTQNQSPGIYGFAVTDKGVNALPDSAAIAGHAKDTYGSAVLGFGQAGRNGVLGYVDGSGIGVAGIAENAGYGLYGSSSEGVAVTALGPIALRANGRLEFSASGVATIGAGKTSVVVTSNVINANTFVLLTPKVNLSGRSLWFQTVNGTTHQFTIKISSSRSSATAIAWLALG